MKRGAICFIPRSIFFKKRDYEQQQQQQQAGLIQPRGGTSIIMPRLGSAAPPKVWKLHGGSSIISPLRFYSNRFLQNKTSKII